MSRLHGEYRRHLRSGIHIPVEVSHAHETVETSTLNISSSGLRLKRPNRLFVRPGEMIQVSFQGVPRMTLSAIVEHLGKAHIGLQLYRKRFSDQELKAIYSQAPAWQRAWARSKRRIWRDTRRFGVFAANTFLRSFIIRGTRPQFVFAVYGNERDAATYFTPSLAKRMPPNLVLGVIQNQEARGLLVASQTLEHELQADSEKVRRYIEELKQDFPQVKRIALVGRLPNFVKKAGIDIADPLVEGSLGTRYMIWDVARQMRARPQYSQQESIVVLGGAGRIGNAVCDDLTRLYPKVIAFDSRYEHDEEVAVGQGTVLRTSNLAHLQDQKLYIGLTSHGDVVLDLYHHMPGGSLIADDTHPCISLAVRESLEEREITVEKVVLSHSEFLMWPRLPAWNNRDIPGCLVEALVLLRHPQLEGGDFQSFCRQAEKMGFTGRLIRPLDE